MRSHPHRPNGKATDRVQMQHIGVCENGKRQFTSRAAAKRSAKIAHHNTHAYQCPRCELWHTGHLLDRDRQWHRETHEAVERKQHHENP